jgi:hypothetical protein
VFAEWVAAKYALRDQIAAVKKLICYSQLSTAQFNVTNQNTLTLSPAAWRADL